MSQSWEVPLPDGRTGKVEHDDNANWIWTHADGYSDVHLDHEEEADEALENCKQALLEYHATALTKAQIAMVYELGNTTNNAFVSSGITDKIKVHFQSNPTRYGYRYHTSHPAPHEEVLQSLRGLLSHIKIKSRIVRSGPDKDGWNTIDFMLTR